MAEHASDHRITESDTAPERAAQHAKAAEQAARERESRARDRIAEGEATLGTGSGSGSGPSLSAGAWGIIGPRGG